MHFRKVSAQKLRMKDIAMYNETSQMYMVEIEKYLFSEIIYEVSIVLVDQGQLNTQAMNPASRPAAKTKEANCLRKVSSAITGGLETAFFQ